MAWHAAYASSGQAEVARVPAPVRMIGGKGSGGTFRASYSAKGAVDFIGVALGRPVFFDAKLCSTARWTLYGRGGLEPHQARQLRKASACGAAAFVALHHGGRGWVVPYAAIHDSPRKTWSADDLQRHAARMTDDGWLDVFHDVCYPCVTEA